MFDGEISDLLSLSLSECSVVVEAVAVVVVNILEM